MDGRGRRNRWIATGLLIAAVGCHRNQVQPEQPGLPKPDANRPSLLSQSGLFGSKPQQFQPTVPLPEPTVAKIKRKKGEPFKPDSLAALANTEVESAFYDGRSPTERDQILDSARQKYQAALQADPKNKAAMLGLARLYTKAGDRDRAFAMYRTAVQANPKDHELAFQMAKAHAQLGDWPGTAEACRVALSLDPENRMYQRTLGYSLAQMGRWDEAFEAMLKVMPEAQARVFLGNVLADLNKLDEARQQMDLALKVDPQCEPARILLGELAAVPGTGSQPIQPVAHQEPAGIR